MTKKQFSRLVRDKRAKLKLTQEDFGRLIGVSWITVLRWENAFSMPKKDAVAYWVNEVTQCQ